MRLVIISAAFAACAGGSETATEPGSLALCLDGPDVAPESRATWQLTGTVQSIGGALARGAPAIDACTWIDGGKSMVLEDGDGQTWTFGWVATAGAGDDVQPMTPDLDVAVGSVLDLELRAWFDWAEELDVMIRDEAGVVFAGAQGFYGEVWAEVASGDGLTVTDGGPTRSLGDDGCGARSVHALTFTADDSVTVDVWEEGTLHMEGRPLQVRNVGAWSFDGRVTCTDVWGPAPWMVWRAPAGD